VRASESLRHNTLQEDAAIRGIQPTRRIVRDRTTCRLVAWQTARDRLTGTPEGCREHQSGSLHYRERSGTVAGRTCRRASGVVGTASSHRVQDRNRAPKMLVFSVANWVYGDIVFVCLRHLELPHLTVFLTPFRTTPAQHRSRESRRSSLTAAQ
jgi:hypothetical protein